MKRIILAAVVSSLSLSTAMAGDNDSAKWSQVGPWHIFVDSTVGNGCFMVSSYGSGTVLRVGFNNRNNTAYLMVGNEAWKSLEAGKQYQISGQFDNGTAYNWTANGARLGDMTVLSVPFGTPSPTEVMQTFGQRLNLKLYYRGNMLASMNLNGTAAAAAETINCNRQFNTKADPFGNGTRPDPFTGA